MSSAILQRAVQVESNLTPIFNHLRASFSFFLQLVIIHQRSHHGVSDVWSEANDSADQMAKAHAREAALNMLPLAERHSRNTTSHKIRNEIGLANIVGRLEVDLPFPDGVGPSLSAPAAPPLPPPAPVLSRPLCLLSQIPGLHTIPEAPLQ